MTTYTKLYINGQWVVSHGAHLDVINPANGERFARVVAATAEDVNNAIQAARAAFPVWSSLSSKARAQFIHAVADGMQARQQDLVDAVVGSMGCPISIARDLQVQGSIDALRGFADLTSVMDEKETHENFIAVKEAIGVCVLINPWNYPLSQLVGKLGPALAAGCTVVLKPAEQTPLQDLILADIINDVGLPSGVVNVLTGIGRDIGDPLCRHPEVDMISFTGSTQAGITIAQAASHTVKRVCQELGGKSPFIIAPGADLEAAVRYGVEDVMLNSGQTCCALTRMLVPAEELLQVEAIAKSVASEWQPADPTNPDTLLGPLSSVQHLNKVRGYIETGIAEGARLIYGGLEVPKGCEQGAYVMPTIFSSVRNDMTIAREEIFGPVLSILPYSTLDEAIALANDTPYGLSSAVYAQNAAAAARIARHIRAGQCYIQGAVFNSDAPFGGYKQSGNGREWGREGLREYTETKALVLDASQTPPVL